MAFAVFAVLAVAWSLAVMRWAFSLRRGRGKRAVQVLSCAALIAAVISTAVDLRAMQVARSARSSDLDVRIIQRGDWWQLVYARDGVAFTTANELHVPAGERVIVESSAVPLWIENATCSADSVCVFVAQSIGDVRFVRVWPPSWQRLRVAVESRDQFERWFANEARPARRSSALFRNAGCAYCHVVRGVANEASQIAPDLTHFASRATIAGTDLPNRRGPVSAWIVHPRGVKASAEMPDNPLAGDDLHAITSFLESLR